MKYLFKELKHFHPLFVQQQGEIVIVYSWDLCMVEIDLLLALLPCYCSCLNWTFASEWNKIFRDRPRERKVLCRVCVCDYLCEKDYFGWSHFVDSELGSKFRGSIVIERGMEEV